MPESGTSSLKTGLQQLGAGKANPSGSAPFHHTPHPRAARASCTPNCVRAWSDLPCLPEGIQRAAADVHIAANTQQDPTTTTLNGNVTAAPGALKPAREALRAG